MQNDGRVFQIPYGTRDYLPAEAAEKRLIETTLAGIFSDWGYDEIVTPTIEYLDTLSIGNGQAMEPQMFKLFDKNNRTLALRHEMTTPIARVVASRMEDELLPLKLSYVSTVFRCDQTQKGRQCEFNQAGVEFIGVSSAMADSEIAALAVKSIQKAGLRQFEVCLGQVEFINGIMEQFALSAEARQSIKDALEKHDLVGLGNIADGLELSEEGRTVLKRIPLLHGGKEVLDEAYALVTNGRSRKALDNLRDIYSLLEGYGVADYVRIDLDVIRDFNYYTGMVFEVYAPGLGYPVCGGGRYDRMLQDFSADCPATGFAIGIERIMLALEQQGKVCQPLSRDVYVAYAPGMEAKAIEAVNELRAGNFAATLSPQAQSEEEAAGWKNARGYEKLVYVK